MSLTGFIEKAARFFAATAAVVAALAASATLVAQFTISTGDEADLRRFFLYQLGQARFDFLCLFALAILGRLLFGSEAVRTFLTSPLAMLRTSQGGLHLYNCAAMAFGLMLLASLVGNGVSLIRTRGVFWTDLVQRSYVETVLADVDRLARSGRVHDAYALAGQGRRVLSHESDQSRIDNRFSDLSIRVELSRRLSQRHRRLSAEAWDPVTQRSAFFANAEAVRLDPQNFQAVELLDNLYGRVVKGIADDILQLCGRDRSGLFKTVSVLESEVFRTRTHRNCEQAAASWLDGIWQPVRIQSLLEQAREIDAQ